PGTLSQFVTATIREGQSEAGVELHFHRRYLREAVEKPQRPAFPRGRGKRRFARQRIDERHRFGRGMFSGLSRITGEETQQGAEANDARVTHGETSGASGSRRRMIKARDCPNKTSSKGKEIGRIQPPHQKAGNEMAR